MTHLEQLGCVLAALPLALRHAGDLAFLERPLLSLLRSEYEEPFLAYFCDYGSLAERWIIFRTDDRGVALLLRGKKSLRSLAVSNPDAACYLVDYALSSGEIVRASFLPVASLPDELLPDEVMYDPSLAPPQDRVGRGEQTLLVEGDWDITEMSVLERRYIHACGALAALNENARVPNAKLAGKFANRMLTQGIVFVNTLEEIIETKPELAPVFAGMKVASPGYIRLKVDLGAADLLRTTLRSMVKNKRRKSIYSSFHSELKALWRPIRAGAEFDAFELRRESRGLACEPIAELLGVNLPELLRLTNSNRAIAGQILATLYRRLNDLLAFEESERVLIV